MWLAQTEWHRRETYSRKRKEETLVNSLHFPSSSAWKENSTEKAWHKFYVDFFLLLREESPPDVRGRVRQTWNVHRNVGESEQSQCCAVTDVVPRILSRE